MNGKALKIIGFVVTLVGFGVSLANDWVADKKLDDKINSKVMEALTKKSEEIES